MLVAFHGETERAWLVSSDGDPARAVWIPKSLTDLGEACGGFERMDPRCQRLLVPIYAATVPLWLAVEKGLLGVE